MDPLSPLYTQGRGYQPRFDGTFWLLTASQVRGLALDETVYRVWQAFSDGTTAEAVARASAETGQSPAFVESTAKVLARAGLLVPQEPLAPIAESKPAQGPIVGPLPLVSVIVLASRQARPHLETSLASVVGQTYPMLEVILVDNQTTDDSVAYATRDFPHVKVLPTPRPLGFGAANNLAMTKARGEFLFLMNEDIELAQHCIEECVRVAIGSPRAAVVAPKMRLFHMRHFLNSMGTSIYPDGRSCDNFTGYLDVGQFDGTEQVFAACFGAAMLRRSIVDAMGDLDERYRFYYEDMDWSYGARLRGYDIVAAPRAVAYHKFSATIGTLGSTFKLRMAARSRLLFAWKNLDLRRARWLTRTYRLEDRLNVLHAKQQGRTDIVQAYRWSLFHWVASWPGLATARWRTRRSRYSASADDAAFALTVAVPEPALYGHYPIVSAPIIRDHYVRLETFRPESAWQPLDYHSEVKPTDSLVSKTRRTLRDEGIVGLVREARGYVRWLVDSW